MIDNLVTLVSTGLKIKQSVSKVIVFSLIGLAVIATCFTVKSCYDSSVVKKHEQKVEVDILKDKVVADENASVRRAEDAIKNNESDALRKKVIDETESQPLPDSSLALGCQRLRQQGYDTSNYAECSGH